MMTGQEVQGHDDDGESWFSQPHTHSYPVQHTLQFICKNKVNHSMTVTLPLTHIAERKIRKTQKKH